MAARKQAQMAQELDEASDDAAEAIAASMHELPTGASCRPRSAALRDLESATVDFHIPGQW